MELAAQAVDCGLWYLAEFEDGVFKLNRNPKEFSPIQDYLSKQGRFSHLNAEDIEQIAAQRDSQWEHIRAKWVSA
jgi:pyruvate ferredoxin oxidoreductase beta subunit